MRSETRRRNEQPTGEPAPHVRFVEVYAIDTGEDIAQPVTVKALRFTTYKSATTENTEAENSDFELRARKGGQFHGEFGNGIFLGFAIDSSVTGAVATFVDGDDRVLTIKVKDEVVTWDAIRSAVAIVNKGRDFTMTVTNGAGVFDSSDASIAKTLLGGRNGSFGPTGDAFGIGDVDTKDEVSTGDRFYVIWDESSKRWEILAGGGGSGGGGITVLIDDDIEGADAVVPTGSVASGAGTTTGTLTIASTFGVKTGEEIDIVWATGARTGVVVGTVAGSAVPISGGSGANLPANGTVIELLPRILPRVVRLKIYERTDGGNKSLKRDTDLDATLATKDSASAGTLTLPDGHTVGVGEFIYLWWSSSSRVRMEVLTVTGNDVAVSGGTGSDLPSEGTAITVTRYKVAVVEYRHTADFITQGRCKVVECGRDDDSVNYFESPDCLPLAMLAVDIPDLPPLEDA